MIKTTKYGTKINIIKNLPGNMVMATAITKHGQFTTIIKVEDIENYEIESAENDQEN